MDKLKLDMSHVRKMAQAELIDNARNEIAQVVNTWPGGITRRELGERSGVAKAHVVRYLQGGRDIKLSTLAALAQGLGYRVRIKLEAEGK